MKGYYLLCLCVVLLKFDFVSTERLYAASVHWRPTSAIGINKDHEIILSYKLIWQQKPLPACSVPNNATTCYFYTDGTYSPVVLADPRWQGYTWRCMDGCNNSPIIADLSKLYYTDVGTFHDISWEAAMEMAVFTFNTNDDMANIKIGFFDSSDVLVTELGAGSFNMAVRNDTGRANISPAIDPLPYYRVPLGCKITISLFPFDGDGDYVRCHWQHNPSRGTNLSAVVLNEDKCELHIHADPNRGFTAGHGVVMSLFAEDFTTQPVKLSKFSEDITTGPFSRTPVLLYLYVSPSTPCNPGPDFIETGTLPPNSVQSYPLPFTNAKLPFKIPTDDEQVILTSGPRYMSFKRNNVSDTIEGTWTYINDTSMTGIHQACGMAYTKEGVPGESRCAVLLVNEPNECPCPKKNGIDGVCRNLFEYHTCEYPPSQNTTSNQQQTLCKPVNPVSENNDDMGLRVGLPVGLSLLLLIIIIATAMYLKQHWVNKMRQSSVKPELMSDKLSTARMNINGI